VYFFWGRVIVTVPIVAFFAAGPGAESCSRCGAAVGESGVVAARIRRDERMRARGAAGQAAPFGNKKPAGASHV
jgi:hypothetical protein